MLTSAFLARLGRGPPQKVSEVPDVLFLELGLKGIAGQVIQLPRRNVDRPDRDRLALRFEQFKKAA